MALRSISLVPRGVQPRPSWVAAAALTVLSSGVVAALTLAQLPARLAAVDLHVAATSVVAPTPFTLSFPDPVVTTPPPFRPAAQVRAPRTARTPAPAARPRRVQPADSRCSGPGSEQRRGEAALASLRRPSDAQSFSIDFLPGRPSVLGLAHLQDQRVEIFVRSCDALSDGLLRHVLAHEIGHLVDTAEMTAALRTDWLRLRGISPGTPWFGCSECSDFATPTAVG